jgi:hypothetical protein
MPPGDKIGSRPIETEKVTFFGVETSPVSSVLTDQLGLKRGIGLVFNMVVAGSPADIAGLKEHDIMLKLDDQWLIDPHQLAVLVRNHKEGDEITITYVRSGKEATTKAKLTLHDAPRNTMWKRGFDGLPDELMGPPFGGEEGARRVLGIMKTARGPRSEARIITRHKGETQAGPSTTILNLNHSDLVYSDDEGTLEVKNADAGRNLTAKDAQGKIIFQGPINTDNERAAIPSPVRARLDQLDHTDSLEYHPDSGFRTEGLDLMLPDDGRNVEYHLATPGVSAQLPLSPI